MKNLLCSLRNTVSRHSYNNSNSNNNNNNNNNIYLLQLGCYPVAVVTQWQWMESQ